MASLGSLGRKRPTVDLDFDYFGETIRVNPAASDLIEIEFLEKAGKIDLDDVDLNADLTPETMARVTVAARAATDATIGSVRNVIHPDDWTRFWSTAITNGQNLADLMELQKTLTEAIAGFPTGQSSGSSTGPTTEPPRSEADLPSQDTTPAPAPEGPYSLAADRSLRRLQGRPDLQVAILRAHDARAEDLISA